MQLWQIKKIWQSMLTLGIILLSRQSKCVTNSCYRGQWVRLYRILQNWEIRETGNLSCEYFCNWQSCPSKGWLCRESSETVLKKVEIGGKNLRKHFLENISYRLFQTFLEYSLHCDVEKETIGQACFSFHFIFNQSQSHKFWCRLDSILLFEIAC